jgi:transposase
MPLSDITDKISEKRKELNLKSSTVNNIITKYRKDGLMTTKSRSGQPLALTERDARCLIISVLQNGDPLGIHSQNLAQSKNKVFLPTIRKVLRERSFYSFEAAQKLFL